MQNYNYYIESQGDHIYDRMRAEKVFIPKGSDSYTEFMEALGWSRATQVQTRDPRAKSLDEWAAENTLSTSQLLSFLREALSPDQRIIEEARQEEKMRDYYELIDALNAV